MPERILLVDDEPSIRRIAQLALQNVGKFSVLVATSGEEALALAARERPDLILLDVMMPVLDGPTVLARLRAQPETERIPVAFLTAKVQRADREHLLGLGAIGVVAKPFNPLTLSDEVRSLLGASVEARP